MATNPNPRRGMPSTTSRTSRAKPSIVRGGGKQKLASQPTKARGIRAVPRAQSRKSALLPENRRMLQPSKRTATRRPVGGRTVRASRGTLVAKKGAKGGKSGS